MTPSTTEPRCLPLAEIEGTSAGGKASGLARLHRLGLNVPPAFVIINARADLFPEDLEAHYAALGNCAVAVRSSAEGEDGAHASFAGQYDTLLNVEGIDDLKAAIGQCVASLHSARAEAYQQSGNEAPDIVMHVLVQVMVDATRAGVLFTADPLSGRHDRIVIDAVAGLGEALVSGEANCDHYETDRTARIVSQELVNPTPLLEQQDIEQLVQEARTAAGKIGEPLDFEWAIDRSAQLYWLQGRPITTVGSDLNELDTPIPAEQVITRCNVGEMMPGAVCPLTFSVQGRAIEHGMQHMHVCWGARPAITDEWTQINMFFGHLFINLTGGLASAAYVSINTPESMAQSLCGRPIPELRETQPRKVFWRRWLGSWKFIRYCMQAPRYVEEFESRFQHMHLAYTDNSGAMMRELDQKFHWLCETNEVHLRSSAGSGLMEGIIQGIVSGGQRPPTTAQQSEAASLLSGASHVESAMLVEQLDEVADSIATNAHAAEFSGGSTAEALAWLQGDDAGAAGLCFADFLKHHGHRSFRELDLREKAWVDEPEKLVLTLQAAVAARLGGNQPPPRAANPTSVSSFALRWLLPKAHNAIRRRERTKSLLVEATHRLKRGYRHLGALLVAEGRLSDADQVFFFTHDELVQLCAHPTADMAERADARRKALTFHERMEFSDIYVGKPEPVVHAPQASADATELAGRPASLGVVEGTARVALSLEEAAGLQPGEILIAPITDVGWTPYFSLIAGLATDVGSAVSHGAVIAREYGLPAVVNLGHATRTFNTGDRVRLDADKGIISKLEAAEA